MYALPLTTTGKACCSKCFEYCCTITGPRSLYFDLTLPGGHMSSINYAIITMLTAGEPRCQEEMLKRVPKVSECSDLSVVETDIVPRINQLCLATTNAGVRVAALSAMAALAPRLPKDHALRSLSTISKVRAALHCLSLAGVMHLHQLLCFPGNVLPRPSPDWPGLHI